MRFQPASIARLACVFLFGTADTFAQIPLLRLLVGGAGRAATVEVLEAELLAARSATVARTAAQTAGMTRGATFRLSAARTPFAEIEMAELGETGWAFRNGQNQILFRSKVAGGRISYMNAEGAEFGYSAQTPGVMRVQHFRLANGQSQLIGYDEVVSTSRVRHFTRDGTFVGDTTFEVSMPREGIAATLLAIGFVAAVESRKAEEPAKGMVASAKPPTRGQQIRYVSFTLQAFEILDDRVVLAFELENTGRYKAAISLRTRRPVNVIDPANWQIQSEAYLSDTQGRRFGLMASDLPFDRNDWFVLDPMSKRTTTFAFARMGQSLGSVFSIMVPMGISWVDDRKEQHTEQFSLYIKDIDASGYIRPLGR